MSESKEKRSPSPAAEKPEAVPNEEDAGEYTSLKDTSVTKPEGSEQPLLKSSDSEGSTSGSESTAAALYARIARLSKQSKEDDSSGKDGDGTPTPEAKRNGKPPPSPGKPKPRPPDPSTKPKISWIHGNTTGSPQPEQQGQAQGGMKALTVPKEKKRSSSDGSAKSEERQKMKDKNREQQKKQEGKEADGSPSKHKPLRGKKSGDEHSSPSHMEHINGVVQNALKKISNFHSCSSEKKSADTPKETPKEPPKSPKVIHPHMNSEAATLLAAQLKEKTQSINRNEGTGLTKTNGLSTPKGNREKPTPPQKAKRTPSGGGMAQQGSTKPLLPTSSSLQKMVAPVTTDLGNPDAKSPEKQDLNGSRSGDSTLDPTPKKTPIKKPPRKKGKEGTLDTPENKTPQQKTAIMPPQVVK